MIGTLFFFIIILFVQEFIYDYFGFGWYSATVIILSLIGFGLMADDKEKAVKGQWRTSEKQLWAFAFCGAAIGATIGMFVLRHKVRKPHFLIGLPMLIVFRFWLFLKYIADII